ncbi:MAG: hypothetical protein OHK0028_04050 [Deltaproteobacteria bacterium]
MNFASTQPPILSGSRRPGRRRWQAVLTAVGILLLPPAIPHLLALRDPAPPHGAADAIFVLTGDEGRIAEGYRAWAGGRARELYILGAGHNVPLSRILPGAGALPDAARSRIHVEGWSENTLENAFSAKSAVGDGNYSSVILVTSDYHVPRAALSFRKVLPGAVSLYAIRVRSEGGNGASWRWARRHFIEGWKYWGYRVLLRWE